MERKFKKGWRVVPIDKTKHYLRHLDIHDVTPGGYMATDPTNDKIVPLLRNLSIEKAFKLDEVFIINNVLNKYGKAS